MIKRTKLKKSRFFIAALTMLSIMSTNSFSASKKSSQQKQQHTEWKQITLEPDLDGDGIKDKIDVEYAEMGGNIYLKFTPYVFTEKAKFEKGKQVEKTITKSDFEEKFDNFVKGFIAEYPKKNGGSQPAVTEQPIETQDTNAETPAPAVENKPEETPTTINNKTDETDKKPVSQKKNTVNSEGNTENDKALDSLRESNMVKAQNTVLDNKNNDNSNNSAQNQNINSSYSYIKQYFGKRPENLTFNFGYDKHSPRDMDEFVFIKTATSIRKEPNSNAKVIKSATYSQKYKTTGIVKTNSGNKSDEWYEVFFDNQLGYIPKSAVEKREFDWNDMMKKVNKTNKFIKESIASNKKLYVLDNYVPLGGGKSGNRDKYGNRPNQSEYGYTDTSFKNYINIPDRTIMAVEKETDKYIQVKIEAYDNGIYYLKPSAKKYLKNTGITGEVTRFIYVDRASQNEMIIEKSGNGWNVVTSSFVTTGKDGGNSFVTPYGTFLIAYSKPVMSYTGSGGDVIGDAKYAVRFSGGGYMHGIPSVFEPKNTREQRKAATAKKIGTYPESHKCIRHYDDQIKFIYEWLGNSSPGHSEGFRVPSVPTVMLVK